MLSKLNCHRCKKMKKKDCKDREKFRKTVVACQRCHSAKAACDTSRPCRRCTKKGFTNGCVDRPRKRPGRPKKSYDELDCEFYLFWWFGKLWSIFSFSLLIQSFLWWCQSGHVFRLGNEFSSPLMQLAHFLQFVLFISWNLPNLLLLHRKDEKNIFRK